MSKFINANLIAILTLVLWTLSSTLALANDDEDCTMVADNEIPLAPIETIPNEILALILSKVNHHDDMKSVRLVSQKWRAVFDDRTAFTELTEALEIQIKASDPKTAITLTPKEITTSGNHLAQIQWMLQQANPERTAYLRDLFQDSELVREFAKNGCKDEIRKNRFLNIIKPHIYCHAVLLVATLEALNIKPSAVDTVKPFEALLRKNYLRWVKNPIKSDAHPLMLNTALYTEHKQHGTVLLRSCIPLLRDKQQINQLFIKAMSLDVSTNEKRLFIEYLFEFIRQNPDYDYRDLFENMLTYTESHKYESISTHLRWGIINSIHCTTAILIQFLKEMQYPSHDLISSNRSYAKTIMQHASFDKACIPYVLQSSFRTPYQTTDISFQKEYLNEVWRLLQTTPRLRHLTISYAFSIIDPEQQRQFFSELLSEKFNLKTPEVFPFYDQFSETAHLTLDGPVIASLYEVQCFNCAVHPQAFNLAIKLISETQDNVFCFMLLANLVANPTLQFNHIVTLLDCVIKRFTTPEEIQKSSDIFSRCTALVTPCFVTYYNLAKDSDHANIVQYAEYASAAFLTMLANAGDSLHEMHQKFNNCPDLEQFLKAITENEVFQASLQLLKLVEINYPFPRWLCDHYPAKNLPSKRKKSDEVREDNPDGKLKKRRKHTDEEDKES